MKKTEKERRFQRWVALRVWLAHGLLLLLVVLFSSLHGCFKPKPKEIITFVEFAPPPASTQIQPMERLPDPTPVVEPEVQPAPIPDPPKPKPTPKPKPKPKPKTVKPKPKPKKPKWKPVSPDQIKLGRPVKPKSTAPPVSASEIRKALESVSSTSSSSASSSRFDGYLVEVMRLFYARWTPPASATAASGSAVVRIYIRKDGQIVKREKIKGSGDAVYDRTVEAAMRAVQSMPKPPPDYPYNYVEIIFTMER